MKKYVIYLSSGKIFNDYGYWAGKVLHVEDVTFPTFTEDKNDENVKVYTSKKRAETMAEKLQYRCPYVNSATVEEI